MTKKPNFLEIEIERIEFDKWLKGCSISADPGQQFCLKWISENAETFRKKWNNSSCQYCKHCMECNRKYHFLGENEIKHHCGMNLKHNCNKFESF